MRQEHLPFYTVTTIYAEALDREQHFGPSETAEERAYAYAKREADDCDACARTNGESWAIYVMEHICQNSESCQCIQWLTDHHPFYASTDWESFDVLAAEIGAAPENWVV